jgi:hypothetical protein
MTKKHIPALHIEVIKERANLGYLSLIEYKRENYLAIIDNITASEITAFVLDYAQQEDINIRDLLSVATAWFYKGSDRYPFSFEVAKNGFTSTLAPIHKTFDVNFVSRIIGNPFQYALDKKAKIKRRRVVQLPAGVEIVLKKSLEI